MRNSSSELLRVSNTVRSKSNLEIVRSLLLSIAIGFIAFSVFGKPTETTPYKECLIAKKQTNLDIVSILEKCKVEL